MFATFGDVPIIPLPLQGFFVFDKKSEVVEVFGLVLNKVFVVIDCSLLRMCSAAKRQDVIPELAVHHFGFFLKLTLSSTVCVDMISVLFVDFWMFLRPRQVFVLHRGAV